MPMKHMHQILNACASETPQIGAELQAIHSADVAKTFEARDAYQVDDLLVVHVDGAPCNVQCNAPTPTSFR